MEAHREGARKWLCCNVAGRKPRNTVRIKTYHRINSAVEGTTSDLKTNFVIFFRTSIR